MTLLDPKKILPQINIHSVRVHKMPATPTTNNIYEPGYAIRARLVVMKMAIDKELLKLEKMGDEVREMLRRVEEKNAKDKDEKGFGKENEKVEREKEDEKEKKKVLDGVGEKGEGI